MRERVLKTLGTVRALVVSWALGLLIVVPQLLTSSGPAEAASPPPVRAPAPPSLTIAWVGDITLGSHYGLPPEEGRVLFSAVRDELKRPDITIGNLEGTLSVGGLSKCGLDSTDCFSFQAPPEYADALRWAGFDAVNLANNHSNDFGADGQVQTLAALDDASIAGAGTPGTVTILRRRGIRVALVGFAPYPWATDNRDLAAVQELVNRAAAMADVVLVLAHLGSEGNDYTHVPVGPEVFSGEDRGDTRAFAHAAIDAGADAVLASGPHVLRGMERYKDRPVAYSLANFAGFHNFATTGVSALSAILEIELTPDGDLLDAGVTSLALDAAGLPSVDQTGAAADLITELGQADFGAAALPVRAN